MENNEMNTLIEASLVGSLASLSLSAREAAYAPYSGFRVGAALLAESGKIYTGCNFENASFGAGTCAERVALGSAIAAGERKFRAICVSAERIVTPCGICRQALSEFGDMEVFCQNADGKMKRFMLSELLPEAFELN